MSSVKGEPFEMKLKCRGLGCAIFCAMSRNRRMVAQREASTGLGDTYGCLLERCVSAALELRRRGLKRRDVVMVCTANQLNSCVPFVAGQFLGACVASLDPTLAVHETTYLLDMVKPKFLFVGVESTELINLALKDCHEEVSPKIVTFGQSLHESYATFEEFMTNRNDRKGFVPVGVENQETDVALIHFSSGTTGMPKGICLSHRAILLQTYALTNHTGYDFSSCLSYATGYWISTTILMMSCFLSGGSRVIASKYDVPTFWKYIDKYQVTTIFIAPTQAMSIINRGRPDGTITDKLEDVWIGGGPLSTSSLEKLRDLLPGARVSLVYGQTEVAGIGLVFRPKIRKDVLDMYHKPGSCGKAFPGSQVRIVDPETETVLGPMQKGELRIKSKVQTVGYLNADSSGIWDSDGWLKTGDIGYYDEDECFYIVDRLKEMLKFRGFHVAPAIIEGVLMQHPDVALAIVVGIPDEVDGDHPAAAVSLKNGATSIDLSELTDFVNQKLGDRFRLRGGIKVVDKFPATATGKIKKSDVKKLFVVA